MSALAPARVGWCPGALAPMASGDGFIVRVKPRGARLSLVQARAIALASRLHGNAALDLTARANIQIRGLKEDGLAAATEILARAGLLDPDADAEAVRNVVSGPLAELDRTAVLDIRAAVEALETRLAEDTALHALPAKFSFVVDDGGRFELADVAADIRFEALACESGPGFAVRLGGDPGETAGRCEPEDIANAAAALVEVFLRERARDGELRRMGHLVARLGAATVLRQANLGLWSEPHPREPVDICPFIGIVDRSLLSHAPEKRREASPASPRTLLGVAAPFGRLSADQLDWLVKQAGQMGATELRLTPRRSILVPDLDPDAAPALGRACADRGFITDPTDARLSIAACTGAPGCHRGSTAVLDHAARLATRLGRSSGGAIRLHVSGCSKGCAHPGKAPLVLVAHNGRYDIVADGTSADRPVLHGLAFEEAAACVKASARMEPRP